MFSCSQYLFLHLLIKFDAQVPGTVQKYLNKKKSYFPSPFVCIFDGIFVLYSPAFVAIPSRNDFFPPLFPPPLFFPCRPLLPSRLLTKSIDRVNDLPKKEEKEGGRGGQKKRKKKPVYSPLLLPIGEKGRKDLESLCQKKEDWGKREKREGRRRSNYSRLSMW